MPIRKADIQQNENNVVLKADIAEEKDASIDKVEDGFAKEPPVIVEAAKSNRSKCSACCEKIESGQDRVGVFGFKGGRLCYAWVHPLCFLKHSKVEYNTSGRGKCKATGKEFVKGQFRFAYRVGGSDKSFAYVSMDGVSSILPKVLEAASDFEISETTNFDELKPEDQAAFTAAVALNRPSAAVSSSAEKKRGPEPSESDHTKKKQKKAPAK